MCLPGVFVFDDLMRHCSDNERTLHLFAKPSHYCDMTYMYLTQNLFPPGNFSRNISLNAHYIITFNDPRDTLWLRTLAQQAFAGQVPFVWESFQQDASSQPFGCLMLNLHPRTPNIQRVRTKILPTEQRFPVIYVNKKIYKTEEPLPVVLNWHAVVFDIPSRIGKKNAWRGKSTRRQDDVTLWHQESI